MITTRLPAPLFRPVSRAPLYNMVNGDETMSNSAVLETGQPARRIDRATLLTALASFALFATLAYFSIALTRSGGRIAAVWLPNALAVAFLLKARLRREEPILAAMWLGNLLANSMHGDAAKQALIFSTANSVEIMLAVFLTRRLCGSCPDMQKIDHLASFVLAACLCAPIASASVATLAFSAQGTAGMGAFFKWAISDALALLILTPVTLIVVEALSAPRKPTRREIAEWAGLTAMGGAVTFAVFYQTSLPLLFFVPLVVVAHAFRLGSLGTAIATLMIAAIATTLTALGRGPVNLANSSDSMDLIILQAFLASSFVIGMPVAAALNGRARMIEELAEQKQRLAMLTDNITDAVLRTDKDGVYTFVSKSTRRVLERDPEELLGNHATSNVHEESQEEITDVYDKLVGGEYEKLRFTYRRYVDAADGEPAWIEADCAMMRHPETGENDGMIICARNVTERVRLEHQLKRARVHAEQAVRAKSEFLANMSHEIRTPMNGVLGFAELLQQSDLPEEQARYVDIIAHSGQSMMAILNDILDISKIEAGELTVDLKPVDVPLLIEECIGLYRSQIENAGVSVAWSAPQDAPPLIRTDPLRLRQILLNLIGNAAKFTHSGEIKVGLEILDEELRIDVSDSGIGISPERLEAIFSPFVQAESSTTRRYGGTGLGLSICRHLAELLGGSLSADSREGEGSRFTICLPLDRIEECPRERERDAPELSTFSPSARVLLAEDNDVNRMLVTAMLDRCGLSLDTAGDGEEAIAKVMAAADAGAPFDLVLMDIQMPGCDGYEATRALRIAGIDADRLPIIALTANAFAEDVNQARGAGMQAHLAKPLVFEELVAALNRWLPHKIVGNEGVEVSAAAVARSPAIAEKWHVRRKEALEALEDALLGDLPMGAQKEALARTMHKLAGTAGMFGEGELGERARMLERALKDGLPAAEWQAMARELLDLAGEQADAQKETAAP